MKSFFLAGLLLLSTTFYATAQSGPGQHADSTVFVTVDQMPEYPGGLAEFAKYLQVSMVYPKEARIKGTEGTVYVGFVVEKTGEVSSVSVLKGISAECNAEAARVIQGSKPWIPGQAKGKTVRVRLVMPIKFSLTRAQKKEKG